jgi:hypothetical protein
MRLRFGLLSIPDRRYFVQYWYAQLIFLLVFYSRVRGFVDKNDPWLAKLKVQRMISSKPPGIELRSEQITRIGGETWHAR